MQAHTKARGDNIDVGFLCMQDIIGLLFTNINIRSGGVLMFRRQHHCGLCAFVLVCCVPVQLCARVPVFSPCKVVCLADVRS